MSLRQQSTEMASVHDWSAAKDSRNRVIITKRWNKNPNYTRFGYCKSPTRRPRQLKTTRARIISKSASKLAEDMMLKRTNVICTENLMASNHHWTQNLQCTEKHGTERKNKLQQQTRPYGTWDTEIKSCEKMLQMEVHHRKENNKDPWPYPYPINKHPQDLNRILLESNIKRHPN